MSVYLDRDPRPVEYRELQQDLLTESVERRLRRTLTDELVNKSLTMGISQQPGKLPVIETGGVVYDGNTLDVVEKYGEHGFCCTLFTLESERGLPQKAELIYVPRHTRYALKEVKITDGADCAPGQNFGEEAVHRYTEVNFHHQTAKDRRYREGWTTLSKEGSVWMGMFVWDWFHPEGSINRGMQRWMWDDNARKASHATMFTYKERPHQPPDAFAGYADFATMDVYDACHDMFTTKEEEKKLWGIPLGSRRSVIFIPDRHEQLPVDEERERKDALRQQLGLTTEQTADPDQFTALVKANVQKPFGFAQYDMIPRLMDTYARWQDIHI